MLAHSVCWRCIPRAWQGLNKELLLLEIKHHNLDSPFQPNCSCSVGRTGRKVQALNAELLVPHIIQHKLYCYSASCGIPYSTGYVAVLHPAAGAELEMNHGGAQASDAEPVAELIASEKQCCKLGPLL